MTQHCNLSAMSSSKQQCLVDGGKHGLPWKHRTLDFGSSPPAVPPHTGMPRLPFWIPAAAIALVALHALNTARVSSGSRAAPVPLGPPPTHPSVPWACEGVAQPYAKQRWFFQPDEKEEVLDRGGTANSEAHSPAVPSEHPHKTACRWLQQHLQDQQNGSSFWRQPAGAAAVHGGAGEQAVSLVTHGTQQLRQRAQKEFLVVAPLGRGLGSASRRAGRHAELPWDLVGILQGSGARHSCSQCLKVYAGHGSWWRLAYALYRHPDWQQLAQRYKAIMLLEGSVAPSAETISSVFSAMRQHNLLMAQPSNCEGVLARKHTLTQHSGYLLRYTNYIELKALAFRMDFFNSVVGPTLYNTYTGAALDYVWPFLLRYPRDRIAVIDTVCAAPSSLLQSAQRLLLDVRYSSHSPYRAKEERMMRFGEYGYYTSEVERLAGVSLGPYSLTEAFPVWRAQVLGSLPNLESRVAAPARWLHGCVAMLFAAAVVGVGIRAICHRRRRRTKSKI